MATLRCWPGALAYIVAPWQVERERGLLVTVVRQSRPGETGQSRSGYLWCNNGPNLGPGDGTAWVIDRAGPEFPCVAADYCLRPITPPPGLVLDERTELTTAEWLMERIRREAAGDRIQARLSPRHSVRAFAAVVCALGR